MVILEDIVVGLFNKARAATSQPAAKSSRSTTWVVTDGKVGEAVHELTVLAAQEKAIAAKKKLFATVWLGMRRMSSGVISATWVCRRLLLWWCRTMMVRR